MLKCPSCGEENPPKFRLCGYCGSPLAGAAPAQPPRELRKTVTLVFSDLKDSTALGERLDSEALHEVKERYFGAMAAEIKRHGGKIEKYIGDAIMAVFGLPRAHEDDALRAVRAAVGMQAALEEVNRDLQTRYGVTLANRTGVNTGEVVTTDDQNATQKLVTGDAVNLAARLEQAAPKDQILIGETTWRLVRDAVEVAAVEPLTLKGKSEPVPAYRLLRVHGFDGNARRHDAPLVGREKELDALQEMLLKVFVERRPRLVTIVADAGMGKTRLVKEMIERAGRTTESLSGRCLPYGDGITFWPLREMVVSAAGIRQGDTPEQALQKLRERVADEDVAQRLAAASGFSAQAFPLHEIYWGARRFLQSMAGDGTLIVLFDDIHWAEPAFLDLLENLVETIDDAPVLMLATARPELLEERADWGEGERKLRLVLQPLDDDAAREVVTNLLGAAGLPAQMIARVVRAAEGNPLYVEQMLGMLIDNGIVRREGDGWQCVKPDADIAVPPTINALLEARLDRLASTERATAEPASVIGLEFPGAAVASLAASAVREDIGKQLTALTRKQFIRPAGSAGADTVFRFHHHLVRDTVYNGLLKRTRANLHIEFVKWADRVNEQSERGQEFEAILGYHLEQAYRYSKELGVEDENVRQIGQDAAHRLLSAGRRAFLRGDMHAAVNLMRRAIYILPAESELRLATLPELAEALIVLANFQEARSVLAEANEAGRKLSREHLLASAQVVEWLMRIHTGSKVTATEGPLPPLGDLISVLEAQSAVGALASAWRVVLLQHGLEGKYDAARQAAQKTVEYAKRSGNSRLLARVGLSLADVALLGPTPVPEAIRICEGLISDGLVDRQVEGKILCLLAQLTAMHGEIDAARRLYRRGRGMLRDVGEGVSAASTSIDLALVELLGGDLSGAEEQVRADYEFLVNAGETYYLSTIAALLARLVQEQGRDDEALHWAQRAEEASAEDDFDSQSLWRTARAPLLARRGALEEAEELARAAVELVRDREALVLHADALFALGIVLRIVGKQAQAAETLGEAQRLYQLKGHRMLAERVRQAMV